MKQMRIYNLSKSARTDFIDKISANFPQGDFKTASNKAKDLKIAELDDGDDLAIIFDREIGLFFGRRGSEYFPLLKDQTIVPALPSLTVDSGAVKFVCNGANVMRPGVVSFAKDFEKGDMVVVKEVAHSKAIALGRVLGSKKTLEGLTKGPAAENLHYIGDKFWEALKIVEA
jgi:malignant T-cell-amplified sequence